MRLIDVDKLFEILEENNQKLQEQIRDAREYIQKEVYEAQYFTVVDIVKLIKEQPTAFDVEQLEEFKEYKKNKHRSLRYMYENRSAMKQLINRYSEEVINELLQLV